MARASALVDRTTNEVDEDQLGGLEDVIDAQWCEVPQEHAETLRSAAPEDLARHPRLILPLLRSLCAPEGRAVALHRALRQLDGLGQALRGSWEGYGDAPDQFSAGVTAAMTLRARGEVSASLTLLTRLQHRLDREQRTGGGAPYPGLLSVQSGIAHSLAGSESQAIPCYVRAVEEAGMEPLRHLAGPWAVAQLALSFARSGHHVDTQRWLGLAQRSTDLPPWVERVLMMGADLARGWLALDRLDREGVDAVLAAVDPPHAGGDLWPFVVELMLARSLVWGDPVAGVVTARGVETTHGPAEGSLGARILQRCHVESLIRIGEANRALRILRTAGDAPWLGAPAARLRLLAGDHDQARAIATRHAWDERTSLRDVIELLLISAEAAWRSGEREAAQRTFDRALGMRDDTGVVRPLAGLAVEVREELLTRSSARLPEESEAALEELSSLYPERLDLVDLTARELTVLQELVTGDSVPAIARRLYVSSNTVRSQIKRIYRKLGASTREAAVSRAEELGVLA